VGNRLNGIKTIFPFTHRFSPCVCTVGNKPTSVPTVGSADTASRNNVRLHLVSCRLQVSAHLFEDQPFRPINDSVNVLANDPARSNSPNNVEHCGPQVAIILCSSPLSCEAERLARESTGKHVDTVFPNGKICCSYVFVLLCIGKVVFEYGSAKRIDLAVESVRPASPLGGEVEPSDPTE
jgi:hypothetical protein